MADKPLYYGGSKGTPTYYGAPAYYGGKNVPAYYGGSRAYGSYGAPAYGAAGGGSGGGEDDNSIVGTITVGRMLRVVSQRWLSVFVFLLIGLVISFAVYRISPTIYEAVSEFTIDMRRAGGGGRGTTIGDLSPDYFGGNYAEIFNTRLSDWRGDKIVTKIIKSYNDNHPASTVSDEEIVSTIGSSKLMLQRNSRIITITVRSKSASLAAAIANAYADAIEAFTEEENKIRCDKAVSQIHANVEKKRREVDKIAKQLLDFRTANKVDILRSTRDTVQKGFAKATTDILSMETQEAQLVEWEKLLVAVQQDPMTFGNLSAGVPRAEDIAKEYRTLQDAAAAYESLLLTYTEQHPEVQARKTAFQVAHKRFVDAAARALTMCRSTLQVTRNQLAALRTKRESLREELSTVDQRIVLAESGLKQYESEFNIASDVLKGLIMDENKARLEAEANNEIVRVGRPARTPNQSVLPNPTIIFGAGVALSIALGLLFVLVLDNLEDTVVNLADIEGRLALKVLAVLPHVRRKKREQVARFSIDEKYSQFSEAVAGLRNLFDSPRYEAMTHCMLIISTQPGEGKTITSCAVAIAYAQAGRRTLLADFDLRRPRQARVWELNLTPETSFSHALQSANGDGQLPDFSRLVNKTSIEGLDVIASLPPEGVTPASIFGSKVVSEFFEWARANYDRIIIDSPPYGLVGDVVSLAVLVDSAIIMCCPDRTHFKPIQYCSRCLTEAGANILGVIVNDVEVANAAAFSPSRHHHYSKYGYGGYGSYGGYGGYGGYYGAYGDKSKGKKKTEEGSEEEEGEFSDDE